MGPSTALRINSEAVALGAITFDELLAVAIAQGAFEVPLARLSHFLPILGKSENIFVEITGV